MQDTVPAVEPLGLRHILKAIGPAARRAIRREGERMTLKAGRALFQVGDPADCLYILLAGALGVSHEDVDSALLRDDHAERDGSRKEAGEDHQDDHDQV